MFDFQMVKPKCYCYLCHGDIYQLDEYYEIDNHKICQWCINESPPLECSVCGYVFGEDGNEKAYKIGKKILCRHCIKASKKEMGE